MKRPTREFLEQRKAAIRRDLLFKVEVEDYHGVADCAMDLREIEAQLEMLPETADEAEARRRNVEATV